MHSQQIQPPPLVDGDEVRAGHAEFIFPCVKPYYANPVVAEQAKGMRVRDADGEEYLDFFSGILTTAIGHCHPEVAQRVTQQMSQLGHTSSLYLTAPAVQTAQRLAALAPGDLKRTLFTNSGSEAVETAIIAARLYTGRNDVIALRHSYHGRSLLATNLNASGDWRVLESGLPGIHHARAPYMYRSEMDANDPRAGAVYADDLEEVIRTCTNGSPAAFIAESVMGLGGYIVPPPGYFERAAEIIRSYGGLFICDEVQAGFGRTGKWWGIDHWNVVPDIMIMAKGIASGFPVGATITTDAIAEAWTRKTLTTYGGNPISMAAANATLDVMVREDVPMRARIRGEQLREGLEALQAEHSWIGEVRGLGLMQAFELVEDPISRNASPDYAARLLEAAKAEGLLLGLAGVHTNVLRIAPSLLISAEEVDDGLARLAAACRRVDSSIASRTTVSAAVSLT